MARMMIGITVSRRVAVVLAAGSVTDAECFDDPDDCCDTDQSGTPAGAAVCCPDGDQKDSLAATVEIPTAGGGVCSLQLTMERTTDGAQWLGSAPLFTNEDCPTAAADLQLYCLPDEEGDPQWYAAGVVAIDGVTYPFGPIQLTLDVDVLVGEYQVPGGDPAKPIEIAIELPCTPPASVVCATDIPEPPSTTLTVAITSTGDCSGNATCGVSGGFHQLIRSSIINPPGPDGQSGDCYWRFTAGGGMAGDCGMRGYAFDLFPRSDGTYLIAPHPTLPYGGPPETVLTPLSTSPLHLQLTYVSFDTACGASVGGSSVTIDITE